MDDLVYVPRPYVSQQQLLRAGDVVVATSSGSISVVGKAVAVQQDIDAGFGAFCGVLRPAPAINKRYFGHYFSSDAYRSRVSELARGVNINNLKRDHFASLELPVAPEQEQQRIADKLDTVLARVDACRERLDLVALLLKRFRQSVVSAAASGMLTEAWRHENSASASWPETNLGALVLEMRNGLSPKPRETPPGTKILRISAVRPGRIDFEDHRFIELDSRIASLHELRRGDLLFTRYNGSVEFVGACAAVANDRPGIVYPDKLIRVRVDGARALPRFLEIVFEGRGVRGQIEDLVKSSAGQKGISGGDLKTIRFALPSLLEQAEILRRVEAFFGWAARIEARLAEANSAVGRLTPSLLAKAFRGELVPQDPADEPAAALLARLHRGQQAPASATAVKSTRGRPKQAA